MAYHTHGSKRDAEDFVRTHHGQHNEINGKGSSERHSKKPRFDVRNPSALAPDAPEDDATLDADVIGSRGQQVRRGAVNIDGYDSDSDNENFDERAEARVKEKNKAAKKSQQEDEDDMFADLEEDFRDGDDSEGDAGRRGGGKKAVRFLDEDEIEGQVKNSTSGGHVSADFSLDGKRKGKDQDVDKESDSDSEVDDAIRASNGDLDQEVGAGGKKSHAPKLDAFNMRSENEEGRFDEQGNYVRKAVDPDTVHDSWMEGISKKDMKIAKEAQEKREDERRKQALVDDAKSTGQILKQLIPQLEAGETVLEALARLNKGKQRKPKWQTKKKKLNPEESQAEDVGNETEEAARKQAIDRITEAADLLLARGHTEIYDTERERLMRQYSKETGEDWSDRQEMVSQSNALADVANTWQYRWSDARDGGEIHGPFDGIMMKQWNEGGYFGEGVEFRQSGNSTWTRVAEFV